MNIYLLLVMQNAFYFFLFVVFLLIKKFKLDNLLFIFPPAPSPFRFSPPYLPNFKFFLTNFQYANKTS